MRQALPIALLGAVSFGAAALVASEAPPHVTPGQPTSITIPLPTADRAPGTVSYKIEPVRGVEILDKGDGALTWNPAISQALHLPMRLVVRTGQAGGRLIAARIALRWSDGWRESVAVWIDLRPAVDAAATSVKDLEAELIPVPRAVAPGATVKLLYTLYSYEDTDERVRLRVEAGPGWRPLDPDVEERELLIEAWEEVEGELYLIAPEDARVGSRQLVRLLVEVIGEPGEIEAQNHVSIVKRGGARPGVPTLSGTSTIGASRLGTDGFHDAQTAGALTLSTKFARQSTASFSYDQGLRQNLSNFRYAEEPTRLSGNLRHAGWDISFGNRVSSPGHALSGPYVRGVGGSVRRTTGLLVSDLTVTQPAVFAGAASGHLVRGRAGVRTSKATIAFSASDFGRPAGGYTTLPPVQVTLLDVDAEEQLEIERRLTAQSPSNRVQGMGLDAELRPARAHRLAVRTGTLWLSNAAGTRSSAPVGEASYAFSAPQKATFSAHWRQMPPTLPGISIPGDELAANGTLRLAGPLRLIGRAYRHVSETAGSEYFSSGEGGSVGLQYQQNRRRLEMRGNYRESVFTARHVRRTVSVLAGVPLGPLTFSANADLGEQDNGVRVDPLAFYRGDLRWTGDAGTVSLSVSHSQIAGLRRQRVDFISSLKLRALELAGGAWATRGYVSGGRPGMWSSIGVPVGYDFVVTAGIDRAPITWTAEPTWRGMLTIRKRFELPLPFGRSGALPPDLLATPPGDRDSL